MTFSDPVDRLLYQDVLLLASSHQPLLKHVPVVLELVEDMLYELRKASVSNHVQGTKVLLAPFFLHNPLYGLMPQHRRQESSA